MIFHNVLKGLSRNMRTHMRKLYEIYMAIFSFTRCGAAVSFREPAMWKTYNCREESYQGGKKIKQ